MTRRVPIVRLGRLAVALLALLGGCSGKSAALRETAPPPAPTGPKVAVAPLENRSNDLTASDIVRGAFIDELTRGGWNVVAAEESDRLLREVLGISYGGQLGAVTPEEVCQALGVEGVFYGEVQEWLKTTTGIYNSVSVVASFKLYRKDGSLAWEGGDSQVDRDVPRGGGGGRELGAEIVGRALVNLLAKPMTPYGKAVGRNIARKVPAGALAYGRAEGPATPLDGTPATAEPSGAPTGAPPPVADNGAATLPAAAPAQQADTPRGTGEGQ